MEKEGTTSSLWAKNKAAVILIAANIVMFLLSDFASPTMYTAGGLLKFGALYTPLVKGGQYWRLFTAMFLHSGLQHLLSNMLSLYIIASVLEAEIGSVKYVILYLAGGLAGNLLEYGLSVLHGEQLLAVGASGAVFSTMGALIYVMLRNHGTVQGLSLSRLLIYCVLSIVLGFTSEGVANAAHVGGLLAGFLLAILLYRKPKEAL